MIFSSQSHTADRTRAQKSLVGTTVYGDGNEKIGTLALVDDMSRRHIVVVEMDGFLGIHSKAVAVPEVNLQLIHDVDGGVYALTSWTKDQVKQLPEYKLM